MKEDNIDELFEKTRSYFDLEEPLTGHNARFLEKLNAVKEEPKGGVSWWKPLSIAASILRPVCPLGGCPL